MRTHAASLLLTGALCAQSVPHPTTIPKAATGAYAGSGNTFVFGRTGGRVQYWYRGDNMPSPPIVTAIGPRAARNMTSAARPQSVEITMSNTTVDFATMSSTFTQNFGTATTVVFTRKNVSLPALSSQQDPDSPVLWLTCDVPFVFLGPHFVVQFDLGPASGAGGTAPGGETLTVSTTAGRHITSDASCGGTLAATSTAASFTLSLAGAPASQPAWFILSANATSIGSLLLPFKLDGIGMTGCVIGVDPLILVATTTTAVGAATLAVPFAAPADSLVVYAQAMHLTTANPAGLAMTNVTRSVLGSTGYCRYMHNFTADGPVAQHGPFPYNVGGCFLLRP